MTLQDPIDEKIINVLKRNTRQSSQKLAKELNISASTIRSRLRRLVKDKVLHFVIAIDVFKAGLPVAAVIALDIQQDKVQSAMDRLANMKDVYYVSLTTGRFDILIYTYFSSNNALAAFLEDRLGSIEGLRDSETLICIDIRKGRLVPLDPYL